jgi:predicted nucleic acid-binding protein
VQELLKELDQGESEAIALALEVRTGQILIDERDGREVARRFGLEPVGVIDILIRAKARGLIVAVSPLLDRLQSELNFFISLALRTEALRLVGE